MAVGDAAGLVDPITGEGIYYAMRSADLASQVLLGATFDPLTADLAYRSKIEEDFLRDLEFGASFAQKLYLGRFLFKSLPPGKYKLKAWAEDTGEPVTQTIEIKSGENSVNVDVPRASSVMPAVDKFGLPRGKAL